MMRTAVRPCQSLFVQLFVVGNDRCVQMAVALQTRGTPAPCSCCGPRAWRPRSFLGVDDISAVAPEGSWSSTARGCKSVRRHLVHRAHVARMGRKPSPRQRGVRVAAVVLVWYPCMTCSPITRISPYAMLAAGPEESIFTSSLALLPGTGGARSGSELVVGGRN